MTNSKHTHWILREHDNYLNDDYNDDGPVEIVDGDGEVVACNTSYYPTAIRKHHAAHIVKCVNMHDELVEALKKIANNDFKDADELWCSEALVTFIDRLNDIAAEALKKAGAL